MSDTPIDDLLSALDEARKQSGDFQVPSDAYKAMSDGINFVAARLDALIAENAELKQQVSKLESQLAERQWIPVADRLPQSGVPVIAFVVGAFGNPKSTRRIRAEYAAKFTLPVSDECNDGEWGDYNEASDEYYSPEGWYESNEYEETHWSVRGTVTHWMPLPDKPLFAVEHLEASK